MQLAANEIGPFGPSNEGWADSASAKWLNLQSTASPSSGAIPW